MNTMITLIYLLLFIGAISITLLLLLLLRSFRNASAEGMRDARIVSLEALFERQERLLREEMTHLRDEIRQTARSGREELTGAVNSWGDFQLKRMSEIAGLQKNQLDTFMGKLDALSASTETRMERLRAVVEERLGLIQEDNGRKLEQIRAMVDEKLHETLERRLGESFKLVSERLEQVQKGLGEMQSLANGVGDLKKVLTNVKTRGTFGEIRLAGLLEQILAPVQYESNVETRPNSGQRVEFALRLPGQGDQVVWLPVDSKFPQEDYLRLVEAQERGDAVAASDAVRQLDRALRDMAKTIRDKYLDPPRTTDFAVMFLPTEGLYAEALRRPELFEALQREYKVVLAGPTTLAALLNSLQMGFRTLAIEKRSSEVWHLLGAVRTEFSKFGLVLEKTRKKLQEAGNQIDLAATRSRVIERKLRDVQNVPGDESQALLESDLLDEDT